MKEGGKVRQMAEHTTHKISSEIVAEGLVQ